MQSLEDELKEVRTSSEKLQQEKTEISTALGAEKALVVSLKKDKSLAIEEKMSALAAQKNLEEDKARLAEERQQAIERAKKADAQNSELQAKLQRLEAELQVLIL